MSQQLRMFSLILLRWLSAGARPRLHHRWAAAWLLLHGACVGGEPGGDRRRQRRIHPADRALHARYSCACASLWVSLCGPACAARVGWHSRHCLLLWLKPLPTAVFQFS
jgi:hypothetical protein